ncbi:MAG: hypothetical protein BGO49_24920 [Planctomycetales bacterium 71-10]|nr:MAG: hypothetical protein BGO49_24920 [Planctomycetales bacterium 71-10]
MIGKLTVPVLADTNPFKLGLAASVRHANLWSKVMGKTVDSAFTGLAARQGGPLAKLSTNLSKISKVTGLAKTGLAVADISRAAGTAYLGVGRLRLAFKGQGEEADKLRARLDRTSKGLKTLKDASLKARAAVVAVDLATFAAKLGGLAGGLLWEAVKGLGHLAGASLRLVAGALRAGGALASMGLSILKATGAFFGFAKAVVKGDWANALLKGLLSLQGFGRAFAKIPGFTAGLAAMGGAALHGAKGLYTFGKSLGSIGWQVGSRGLGLIVSGLSSVGSMALSTVGSLAKVGSVVGIVVGALGVKAAASAAHLNETFNATEQVFGKSAEGVIQASKEMAGAFGTNQKAFLEGSNALGSLLQGMGFAQEDSAKLGTSLSKLAADASAFRDVPLDVALQKIRSGLSGEAEPLKEWGILIDENTVKNYALTHGLAKQGAELSNAAKAQARLALISQGLSKDQGALAREATGPAAQISEFWGRLQNLVDTVGASLAPVLGGALETINVGIAVVTENWHGWSTTIVDFVGSAGSLLMDWGGAVLDFFELSGEGTSAWTIALGVLANGWQALRIGFDLASSAILQGLSLVLGAVGKVVQGVDWVVEKLGGSASGIGDYFERLASKTGDAARTQADKFVNEMSRPWASMDGEVEKIDGAINGVFKGVGDAFRETTEKIKEAREAAAKPLSFKVEQEVKEGDKVDKAKKGKAESHSSGAFEFGSKESTAIAARQMFQGLTNDPAKQTAKNTERGAKLLDSINRKLSASNSDAVVGLLA